MSVDSMYGKFSIVDIPTGFFPYSKSFTDSGTGDRYETIYYVPLAGGTPVEIITDTTISRARYEVYASPDYARVVYRFDDVSRTSYLTVCDADGLNELVLDTNFCVQPQWHPNGSKILYRVIGGADNGKVYTIQPDGANKTLIASLAAAGVSPVNVTYNRDGTLIGYMLNYTSPTLDELKVMNADGSNQTLLDTLSDSSPGGMEICWGNLSDVIVYPVPGVAEVVYKINANGTGKTQLTTGTFFARFSRQALTDDDLTLYVQQTFPAPWRAYTIPLSGSGETVVSPSLDSKQNTANSVLRVAGGRVYTVRDTTFDLVSIMPDGSDLRIEDIPLSGPPTATQISEGVRQS